MSTEDYMKQLLSDPKIAEQFNRVLTEITEQGERDKAAVRQKYTDALIDEYGTVERDWKSSTANGRRNCP